MNNDKTGIWKRTFLLIRDIFNHLSRLLWYGRVSVVALLVIFASIWFTPQGQDILVGMPEKHSRVVTAMILITAMATLNWYYPRLFYPSNADQFQSLRAFLGGVFRRSMHTQTPPSEPRERAASVVKPSGARQFSVHPLRRRFTPSGTSLRGRSAPTGKRRRSLRQRIGEGVSVMLPRFLGVWTFLLLSGGLLLVHWRSQEVWVGDSLTFLLLLGSVLAAGIITYSLQRVQAWLSRKHRWLIIVGVLLSAVLLMGPYAVNTGWGLPVLALSYVLMALVFGIFVTVRTKALILAQYFNDDRMAAISLLITGISAVAFVLLHLDDSVHWVFPLNILLLGLVFYICVINLILFLGQSRNTYFLNILIVFFIVMAAVWQTPLHRITETEASLPESGRVAFNKYLETWLADRGIQQAGQQDSAATTSRPYPVFLVLGEGGGSRAAFWTNLVLTTLQDTTRGTFAEHCLAITSVSGSSFGSASFIAMLEAAREAGGAPESGLAPQMVQAGAFKKNYLSTSLLYFLGADFWRTIFPPLYGVTGRRDRAYWLEEEWTEGVRQTVQRVHPGAAGLPYLRRPYTRYWYDASGNVRTDLPLYLPNSTHVASGNRVVISPVTFLQPRQDQPEDFFGLMGNNSRDISLVTAALLSARFPYINPAGKLPNQHQLVDGGYYDNIGGTTAAELLGKINQFLVDRDLSDRVEVHLMFIFNGDDSPPSFSLVSQLMAPISAIGGAPFGGHTEYWNKELVEEWDTTAPLVFRLDHDIRLKKDGRRVIMPLARYLSESAALGIRQNLNLPNNASLFQRVIDLLPPDQISQEK